MISLLRFGLITSLLASSAPAALLIYYPLDETFGSVATDAAPAGGAQNAVTINATPDWLPDGGIVGGGLRLSPTAQADVDEAFIYDTATTGTSLLTSLPLTLSMWFKTTDTTAFNRAALFLGDRTQNASYYAAGLSATHLAQMVARNTTAVNTAAPTAANDGLWHQLTAIFESPTSRIFYLDGQLAGTSTTNVPHMTLNRFALGALTRLAQTDAFAGILDEAGLFDTALTPQHAALLHAFPLYDPVMLDNPDYETALDVFNTQTGSVDTGEWTWSYATGLPGVLGSTGTIDGNPYVVLDHIGNGIAAVPEPTAGLLFAAGAAALGLVRRRRGNCS